MKIYETLKKKVGDTIVEGTTESAKNKLVENKDELIDLAITTGVGIVVFIGAIRLVTPPRPSVNKIHIYVHTN